MESLLLVWARHEPELRRWLHSHAPVASEVDDLLQEVFIKTLRQGARWQTVQQPRAWLFEVARNALIDRVRSAEHRHLPLPEDIEQWPVPEATPAAIDQLAQACLPRVLGELSAQDREAIELCDIQGMDQAAFARLKNLSLPAAKSRVQRARRRMREHMTQACQVRFDATGRVDDFVPRPSPDSSPERGASQ